MTAFHEEELYTQALVLGVEFILFVLVLVFAFMALSEAARGFKKNESE